MKKIILLVAIVFIGINGFAQKKSGNQVDLDNIKRYFDRLKSTGVNPKEELIWTYTYEDTTETNFKQLIPEFEAQGLKVGATEKSKKVKNHYLFHLTEVKKYNPEELNDRLHTLNAIASSNNVMYPDALFDAEKKPKEYDIPDDKSINKKRK